MNGDLIKKMEDELQEDASGTFSKAVSLALLEKLDDEGRKEYVKIAKEGADSEKLEKFLREKISNYDQVIEDISAYFE